MAMFTKLDVVQTGGVARTVSSFVPGRVIAAVVVLVLIFGAGVYCAHDAAMKDWSTPLLHTFELLLGGVVGLLVGEKTAPNS